MQIPCAFALKNIKSAGFSLRETPTPGISCDEYFMMIVSSLENVWRPKKYWGKEVTQELRCILHCQYPQKVVLVISHLISDSCSALPALLCPLGRCILKTTFLRLPYQLA